MHVNVKVWSHSNIKLVNNHPIAANILISDLIKEVLKFTKYILLIWYVLSWNKKTNSQKKAS